MYSDIVTVGETSAALLELGGLEPSTKYEVYVKSNENGTMSQSNVISTETAPTS